MTGRTLAPHFGRGLRCRARPVLGSLEGEAEEVDVEEDQDEEVCGADEDDGAAGPAEVGVGGLDATELDPPADGHDGDGVLEEDESDDADEAEEGEEDGEAEGEERAEHDAEVAGVVAGLADAGGGGCSGGGGFAVDRGGAEGALPHGGVDGFVAGGAEEDFYGGG